MKKYLRISNTADNVSRIGLEKLGLSTKRDNPTTIGQFGSGIKYAPIAALRNGWEWAFAGHDDDGDYLMHYSVVNESGVDCVQYDYGHYTKPSSFTLEAGTLSWTDPFQIYREAVANAMDGANEYGGVWSIDLVDKIKNERGMFSVFITAAPELVEVYNNHDKYFSNNREPVYSSYKNNYFYEKIDSKFRVYCLDVLVYSSDVKSIYDYRLDTVSLNEERTVKSEYSMQATIEMMITGCGSEGVIERIIRAACSGDDFYEFSSNSFNYLTGVNFNPYWVECFHKIYGENAVILDDATSKIDISPSLKANGLKPIVVEKIAAFKLLKGAGIPTVFDKLTESVKYDIDEDLSKYPNLVHAVSVARLAEPGLETYIPSLAVFSDTDESILGMTINMHAAESDRRIIVAKRHAQTASVSNLIATLLHEYDHASTGIVDGYDQNGRLFRDLADKRIGRIVESNFKSNPLYLEDGVVGCRPEDIYSLGVPLKYSYEYSSLLEGYIVITNNIRFVAIADMELPFGFDCSIKMNDDGSAFVLDNIKNVKEIQVV
jgi:hypothetical protein